jgi:hypothetical protein
LDLGRAEPATHVDRRRRVAVDLIRHRVDQRPCAPVEPARDQGEYDGLDEVVKVDDPDAGLELAGVLELMTNEPREGCSITRLGRDGDAGEGSVDVAVGLVSLCVVAGEPPIVRLDLDVGPEPRRAAPTAPSSVRSAASG